MVGNRAEVVSNSRAAASVLPRARATPGGSGGLRYDTETATWTFNWSTRPLAAGCYAVRVSSSSPVFAAPMSAFAVALLNK